MIYVMAFLICNPANGKCVEVEVSHWPSLPHCEVNRPFSRHMLGIALVEAGMPEALIGEGECRAPGELM